MPAACLDLTGDARFALGLLCGVILVLAIVAGTSLFLALADGFAAEDAQWPNPVLPASED